MKRVHVNITTHKRPNLCLFVLQQIYEQSGEYNVSVSVFHDRCDSDYSMVKEYCEGRGYEYIVTPKHLGKWEFWRLNNRMYRHLEKKDYDYYVQMQDDLVLVDGFFSRLIPLIKDQYTCINYLILKSATKRYWNFQRRRINGVTLIETGWIDNHFCTTRQVMTGFRIKRNWRSVRKNPMKSSGTGAEQSAAYAQKTGRKALSLRYSLCEEVGARSVMHNSLYEKRHRRAWVFDLRKADEAFVQNKRKEAIKSILFYPEALQSHSKLFFALEKLGICHHVHRGAPHELSFFWRYNGGVMRRKKMPKGMINRGCTDVSKTRVAQVFDDIMVDPQTYVGPVVRKTEAQCDRKETLIMCPAPKEDGYIYRRLIDTREGDEYVDYRLYWFGGPGYLVKRYKNDMLAKRYSRWELVPLSLIPEKKMQDIERGCKKFGFDFGEIDLLKNCEGWFVIDLNNTAGTPRWFKGSKEMQDLFIQHTKEFIYEKIR